MLKKVIPSPWLINNKYLKNTRLILLFTEKIIKITYQKELILFSRTKGVSTTILRRKSYKNYKKN